MIKQFNYTRLVVLTIVITAIARIFIALFTGLGIGESYYFGGVMHPALSYFDQPPLFFWLTQISVNIFGVSTLSLRLPSILLFAASTWLIYRIGTLLFFKKAAFYTVLLLNLSFVFTVPTATWLQPDAALLFFWLAVFYYLIQFFFPKNKEVRNPLLHWVLIGFLLGLATLSKYHSIFLVFGVFVFIVLNKDRWYLLAKPWPYAALLVCLVVSLPVFIWNSEHNWASFVFQGSRAGTQTFRLHFDWFARSIIGQSLWIAPWIWVPVIVQFYLVFKYSFHNAFYSFIFWLAAPPIVLFTIITLWTNTAFHFHWQAPGYVILFIIAGKYIAIKENEGPKSLKFWKGWWAFSTLFLIGFSLIALIYTETGFLKRYGPGWFTQKFMEVYDPTVEGYDFDDIAVRFNEEGWLQNDSIFVITNRWYNAGKIDWPLRGKMPLLVFSNDPRNYAYFDDPNKLLGFDAIILVQANDNLFAENATHFFDSVVCQPDLKIFRGKIHEANFRVYRGIKFKKPITDQSHFFVYKQLLGLPPY